MSSRSSEQIPWEVVWIRRLVLVLLVVLILFLLVVLPAFVNAAFAHLECGCGASAAAGG
ncbi:MAG: hypothetical protein RMK01_11620 [Thermomicrobium sp.]|nr:hypothetical protein [Thermomicrobium sp.]MDW8060711.1 hypothetical protein [Thermomicrobium sp.]